MMRRLLWLAVLLIFAVSLAPALALAKKPVSDKGKILFVPHDNRPISDEQTADTIKRIGWEIETPPDDILGSRERLGNPETVWNWLEERAKTSDIAVLSSDTLIYGSLVGSRKHDYSEKKLLERVEDGRLVRRIPFAERDARRARGNRGRAAPAHEEGALGILAELEDEEPRGEERRGGEEEAEEAFHG